MSSSELLEEATDAVRPDQQPGPIADLAILQRQHGLPDDAFAKQIRLGYTGSTWGKIKSGTFDGNQAKAQRAVRQALAAAQGGLDSAQGRFVLFEHIKGVLEAIEVARMSIQTPNRLVVYVASMGLGKSEICKHLSHEQGAVLVEGQPSWGSSYMASLRDIAEALGIDDRFVGRHDGERLIIRELKANPRLIAIDEGNYFTTDGLNFIKTILNKTACVVVLATLPQDFARWKAANRHESRQLVRRSVGIFRAPAVTARDVRSMQAAGWPDLHINGCAPKIAAAANRFGGLDFVTRVLDETDPSDPEDAEGAIQRLLERFEEGGAR